MRSMAADLPPCAPLGIWPVIPADLPVPIYGLLRAMPQASSGRRLTGRSSF